MVRLIRTRGVSGRMKGIATAVILMILAASAVFISCAREPEAPSSYASHQLRDVIFSYPSNWIDVRHQLEEKLQEETPGWEAVAEVAYWGEPSDWAFLGAIAYDLDALGEPADLTPEDKLTIARRLAGSHIPANATIQSEEETRVANRWAWEVKATPESETIAFEVCFLVVFHERTAFCLFYGTRKSAPVELTDVYLHVRESISFNFSTPTPEATPTPAPIAGYLLYVDEAEGFSIYYPQDWHIMPEHRLAKGVVVNFYAPEFCGEDVPKAGAVWKEELLYSMNVRTYFDASKEKLPDFLDGYIPISEKEVTVDGRPAVRHVFNFSLHGTTLQAVKLYVVEERTAWVVTSGSIAKCWDDYKNTFDTISGSFRFLE